MLILHIGAALSSGVVNIHKESEFPTRRHASAHNSPHRPNHPRDGIDVKTDRKKQFTGDYPWLHSDGGGAAATGDDGWGREAGYRLNINTVTSARKRCSGLTRQLLSGRS